MSDKVGVWLVGAQGDIATTVVVGATAIARGLSTTQGLVSSTLPLKGLAGLDELVFAGHDVRDASPFENAVALAKAQLFPESLVVREALEAFGKRIRPGVAFGCGSVVANFESTSARRRREDGPRSALAAIREDLRAFKGEVDRLVVVHLTSTEPVPPPLPASEEGVRSAIDANDATIPASVLYALAAADEGAPYVNFTPCLGAAAPGVQEAFARRRVPHAGRDGKTGETLLRSALAPLFLARNLEVLSWVGYNILGNRDGQVLEEPAASAAKKKGKEQVLRSILGGSLEHAATSIDYVPSLGDWKTSWDHVHFEGFLGMRGTLQLTWRASDSALAAPLVLDLVRLIDLAARRGKSGVVTGLSAFFKDPTNVGEHSLHRQMDMLGELVKELAAG